MKDRRGSALMQVLVVAAVAGFVCAALLRARLQPAMLAAQGAQRVVDDTSQQGALNRVTQVWMERGSCSSDAAAGVSCVGSGCACTCTVAGLAVVTAVPNGGACALSTRGP